MMNKEEKGSYPQAGVAVTCRSAREYEAMFALDMEALGAGPILDVAAGASSFVAEMRARGYMAVAADPRYAKSPETLYVESLEEIGVSTAKLEKLQDRFDWTFYGSLDAHRAGREKSLEEFISDYRADTEHQVYVPASLPSLPFADDTFALVLCSHFLFLYEEQFSPEFHQNAVRELYRVTRPGGEVRLYPLHTLRFEKYSALGALKAMLEELGAAVAEAPSLLPFLPGSTHMLTIRKP
jgi:SAM-dependent methyltransferase